MHLAADDIRKEICMRYANGNRGQTIYESYPSGREWRSLNLTPPPPPPEIKRRYCADVNDAWQIFAKRRKELNPREILQCWCHYRTSLASRLWKTEQDDGNRTSVFDKTEFVSGPRRCHASGYHAVVRFEMSTAVTMKNYVSLDVTSCGSSKNRSFGGTYHLHHQGEDNQTAKKS
jgi:hypothetical protein